MRGRGGDGFGGDGVMIMKETATISKGLRVEKCVVVVVMVLEVIVN